MASRKITAYKGGRSERVYARITPEAKLALLARVDREGYRSLADWLEAQAMPQLTMHAADLGKSSAKKALSQPGSDPVIRRMHKPAPSG